MSITIEDIKEAVNNLQKNEKIIIDTMAHEGLYKRGRITFHYNSFCIHYNYYIDVGQIQYLLLEGGTINHLDKILNKFGLFTRLEIIEL